MHGDGYGTGSRPDVRKSKKIILTLQIKKTQKLETRCVSVLCTIMVVVVAGEVN